MYTLTEGHQKLRPHAVIDELSCLWSSRTQFMKNLSQNQTIHTYNNSCVKIKGFKHELKALIIKRDIGLIGERVEQI